MKGSNDVLAIGFLVLLDTILVERPFHTQRLILLIFALKSGHQGGYISDGEFERVLHDMNHFLINLKQAHEVIQTPTSFPLRSGFFFSSIVFRAESGTPWTMSPEPLRYAILPRGQNSRVE